MATTFGTEEFIIDARNKQMVEKHKSKIDRLFKVTTFFDVVSKEGGVRKQWLGVSGSKDNRENAKSYIVAMCHPEETRQLVCNSRRPVDDMVLEEVEERTSAFLRRTGSYSLEVLGSELSCTLAISQLEHTYPVKIVDEDGVEQPKMDQTRSALNPSPTGISHQVEALNVDCAEPNSPDSIEDHRLFASGQNSGESGEYPITLPPVKRAGFSAEPRGKVKQKAQTVGGSGEPASDAQKQKADFLNIGQGMGYSEQEIKGTLPFFDFSDPEHPVQMSEFLCALDEVRSSKQTDKNPGPAKKGGKIGKEKQPGQLVKQSMSASPVKSKAALPPKKSKAASPQKNPQSAHTMSTRAGSVSSPVAKRDRRDFNADDSVILMGENLDGSNKSRGKSRSQDDSVILVDDSFDESVCIVDAFSPAAVASGWRDTGRALPTNSGCKRKGFADDEEQTSVLKPFSTNIQHHVPPSIPAHIPQSTPAHLPPNYNLQPQQQMEIAGRARAVVAEPSTSTTAKETDNGLRYVVIDGSNVAMSHGNDKVFSCKGIKLCVDYFVKRGHQKVKAWVPLTKSYRNQTGRHPAIYDQHILEELKDEGYLGFTPARTLGNKHIVNHDDYFILDLAKLEDAVIVSKDNFREFLDEYREIITNRVLSYVFADDHFMLPRDPLGRNGPTLEQFLSKRPIQPAGQGEAVQPNFNTFGQNNPGFRPRYPGGGRSMLPYSAAPGLNGPVPRGPQSMLVGRGPGQANPRISAAVRPTLRKEKEVNPRHPDVTRDLMVALKAVFPEKDQELKIQEVLDNHQEETNLNRLTNYCISALFM